ncbi:DUF4166 domain-containing protein [Microbacterium aurantiacum]|uniref:DUF4166 domain-containing protein n=1 Tax=Microbacterium aurantiacum TaxID=162393 RepID=UPI001F3ACD7F|nr:DUF4166 domain-containing protein [Microbacterium aurantiacum]
MTSVFRAALGEDAFSRLHPMLQRRFDVRLGGEACVGTGVMTQIRRGPWWTVPFLQIGRMRNILIPDVSENVPFRIDNRPYLDPFGRETVTFVREYVIDGKRRRFDATMILSDGRVVDYLGTHQHLAVDLDLSVQDDGSLLLRSGAQRFHEGPVSFRFPMSLSGRATLRERFDDADGRFHIDLEVHNDRFGFLFGYRGSFVCEWMPAGPVPPRLLPLRHEPRV